MGYAEEMKVLTNTAKEKGKLDALNEYNTVLDYIKQKVRDTAERGFCFECFEYDSFDISEFFPWDKLLGYLKNEGFTVKELKNSGNRSFILMWV